MADGPEAAGVAHINDHGKQNFGGVMACQWTEDKGRILHATCEFAEGDIILVESPLHIVQEDHNSAAWKRLTQLCKEHPNDFDYEPLWYWCALKSLTKKQLSGANHGGWQGADEATQHNLLLLHHDEVVKPSRSSEILAEDMAPGADAIIIERLTQIWVLNCFEYSEKPQGYSTYFFSSFMSHSCWPNAVWHYTGADHVLRARRAIEVGDEVCISYLPEHGLMQSAPVRRTELHDTKRFWCACHRCSGELDHSRGFVCPKCQKGKVFARTPDAGPAQDDTLMAAHLVGSVCAECQAVLTKKDAARLAGHEKKLKNLVEDYSSRAQAGGAESPTIKDLQATESFIDSIFAQHVLADLAWEQLADLHAQKRRVADQRRLLDRRLAFHASAYPGLNGSHAWTLEAFGDAMMRSVAPKPVKPGAKRVWQVAAKEDPQKAADLFQDARRILCLMFGEEHEYVLQVDRRHKAALLAVAQAAEAALVAEVEGDA